MINTTNLTIKEASVLIAKKQISATELTQAYLEKAQNLNGKLNSFITISRKERRAWALMMKRSVVFLN